MDWTTGLALTWSPHGEKPKIDWKQVEREREKRQAEQKVIQERAAEKARYIWNKSEPADNSHPYLLRKRIQSHGARVHNDCLVVPIFNREPKIVNLQFIQPDGTKRFLTGGKKKGCFSHLGDLQASHEQVMFCEGFSTGSSLFEQYGDLTVVCLDAGNILSVAEAIRLSFPAAKFFFCADNDEVGLKKAHQAARIVGGTVAVPPIPDMDFNDYFSWEAGNEH